MKRELVELKQGNMSVVFNKNTGAIWSLKEINAEHDTNYFANEDNVSGEITTSQWTGDIVTCVWILPEEEQDTTKLEDVAAFQSKGHWQREVTFASGDIRKVRNDEKVMRVIYSGESENPDGIKSLALDMSFSFNNKDQLVWKIALTNQTNHLLEIGELGLVLAANNDYRGVYDGKSPLEQTRSGKYPLMQKKIHEERVLCHNFVAGHSSYSLLQRPLGNPSFLLLHTSGDTSLECVYHTEDHSPWPGPDILALNSWATKKRRSWQNDWVNGHTSLILKPGETRNFEFLFSVINSYDDIRTKLYESGNLGIKIIPSMVVQEDVPVYVEIQSKNELEGIDVLSDNVNMIKETKVGDKTLLTLSFKHRGQKTLKIRHDRKGTNLHFFCVENLSDLIKARGEFIINRQFYENPDDPFNRHHMFLPFDYGKGGLMLESDEAWEVGGSDEFGFSEPLYLAEKNIYSPSKKEVDILETYVQDCLFKHIQNPKTYEIRASLFWRHRYPSSPWGHWPKERSEQLWRTYNYPHPANIYHDLYKIGKMYGLISKRKPLEYLRMSYETCMKWFNIGHWPYIGLMCGSNAINILNDIKAEGWEQEYESLLAEMKKCAQVFADDSYPFGSELIIDQTAHEQVYFFTRFFGDTEKQEKTLQAIKALRGGDQPVWFHYGNDKRGDMACWYSESLNGWALLQGFEDTGDMSMFIKGYAGVMSITANILPDGMGFGWFISTPGIFANNPPRTLDNGIATYGFFKAIKSYVMHVEPFGLIGCGCKVKAANNLIEIEPKDGLRKRIYLVDQKISIDVVKGEIRKAEVKKDGSQVKLFMEDPSGLADFAEIGIQGLSEGEYVITFGKEEHTYRMKDELILTVPMNLAEEIDIRNSNKN